MVRGVDEGCVGEGVWVRICEVRLCEVTGPKLRCRWRE